MPVPEADPSNVTDAASQRPLPLPSACYHKSTPTTSRLPTTSVSVTKACSRTTCPSSHSTSSSASPRDYPSPRQKCPQTACLAFAEELPHDHVAKMNPNDKPTHTPSPRSSSLERTDDNEKLIQPTINYTMVDPELSPRNLPLPQSPSYEDSDSDSDVDHSHSPPRRPARLSRPGSESSISSKPIIHQQPLAFRPRNHSPSTPLARPHTSIGISLTPLMQRAHSSPGVDSTGRFITPQYHTSHPVPRRPASPLSAGSRRRSPLRAAMEESYPSWSGLAIEPNIPEHAELDLSEDYSNISPIPSYHNTFPRSRRRPASPLHPSASAPSLSAQVYTRAVSPHTTGTSSPGLVGDKRYYINEAYPASFSYSYSSASSMPSTPSSLRSRSPSISSLETIEDSPDAEEAAMNAAEDDAKFRLEEQVEGGESKRRASLESRGSTLRSNKERKRWSVCGAERRADFSLEVIEE